MMSMVFMMSFMFLSMWLTGKAFWRTTYCFYGSNFTFFNMKFWCIIDRIIIIIFK